MHTTWPTLPTYSFVRLRGSSSDRVRPRPAAAAVRAVTKPNSQTEERSPVLIRDPSCDPCGSSNSQPSRNGILGSFSLPFTPLWALVAGWKQQSKEEEEGVASGPEIVARTAVRASEASHQEATHTGAQLQDISQFIRPAGMMEIRYVRLLSSLCAQTYIMHKLTPRTLFRRYRLRLVTTSHACERSAAEIPKTASQVFDESDAMAATVQSAERGVVQNVPIPPADVEDLTAGDNPLAPLSAAVHDTAATAMNAEQQLSGQEQDEIATALATLHHLSQPSAQRTESTDTLQGDRHATAAKVGRKPARSTEKSPTEVGARLARAQKTYGPVQSAAKTASSVVGAKLAAAAAAATAAAAPLASSLATAGNSFPMQTVASQLQSAASAGTTTAVATFATVSAAIATTLGRGEPPRVKASPVEWFVADEPETHTRFFVIQGSDTFDHWKVNLTFDPVPFEDPSLGVKVHRGVYQTALALLARFQPLVEEHLASSPFAKISFTGHSLGGSLATLLLMMYLRRGILPAVATSPTYTFGAPAVFCEGDCASPDSCRIPGTDGNEVGGGLLATLGLPNSAVRNVLMSRDIVPRAFACNYALVADILKRVSTSFRDHQCLSGGKRVALYYSVGRALVLQPAAAHWFTKGFSDHPLLPRGAGLFVLQDPLPVSPPKGVIHPGRPSVTSTAGDATPPSSPTSVLSAHTPFSQPQPTTSEVRDAAMSAAVAGAAASLCPLSDSHCLAGPDEDHSNCYVASGKHYDFSQLQLDEEAKEAPAKVLTARGALNVLMDNPHPLDILGDPASYGPTGAVSRFHNPDNYTAALGGVLRAQPWWLELLASGRSVTPPTCTGPRFYHTSAPREAPRDTRTEQPGVPPRDSITCDKTPPPEVPINQVLPCIKPLYRQGAKAVSAEDTFTRKL